MKNGQMRIVRVVILTITNGYIEEIMRKFSLGKREVINKAITFFGSVEISDSDIIEILSSLKNECTCFSVRSKFVLSAKVDDAIEDMGKKYGIKKGHAIDIIVALYKKECKIKADLILEKKKKLEPKKEYFDIQHIRTKILFVLYEQYPEYVYYDKFESLIEKAGLDNNETKLAGEEIKFELKKCVAGKYVYMLGRGISIRYILTNSGLSYLTRRLSTDLPFLLFRISPFLKEKNDWLTRKAEIILQEKSLNTLENIRKYFFEAIESLLKSECIKNNESFQLNDYDITLIIEKLLEEIISKNLTNSKDDVSLNNNEKTSLAEYISRLESEESVSRKRMYAGRKIILCLLGIEERTLFFREIRKKAGLLQFYGNYADIFNQLEKNGWITVSGIGDKKEVKVTNKNIRTILGIVKKPSLAEKLLELLKNNKKLLG